MGETELGKIAELEAMLRELTLVARKLRPGDEFRDTFRSIGNF